MMARLPSSFLILFGSFVTVWIGLAIRPYQPSVWLLENIPVVLFAGLMWYFRRWASTAFRPLSLVLLFGFAVLHLIGAHYTYAEVPMGRWFAEVWALTRNPYDRIVHFCFGLMVLPAVEDMVKALTAPIRGAVLLSAACIMAMAALFEITEWLLFEIAGKDSGTAYLATQGDPLDPYKDLAAAMCGACVCHFLMTMTRRGPH